MTRTLVSLLFGCVLVPLFCASALAAPPPAHDEATKNAGSVVATTPTAEPTPAIAHDAESAVVKVFSTIRRPDLLKPWTKQSPAEVTGSGVVIEGHRILTNAHVVTYASQVQVQGNQAGDKVFATVVAIATGIDLAVLQVDDKSFFDTRPPLPRASVLPQIKDPVLAYGFPTGGTSLSITKGIVSRIEFVPYNYPVSGLRIQIDAAINPGNSGGPAVAGDKMIGLAFSTLNNAQNIGYIIPNEEIELFLKDIADGRYDGKPALFDNLQTLENPALRSFLKLGSEVQGIVVLEPFARMGPSPLKTWDVITRIGDSAVDDQGMVQVGPALRIHFFYLVQHVARNGKVPLTIFRAGKTMTLQMPVSPQYPLLVPEKEGNYPSYFIYGPLVFSRGSSELARAVSRYGGSAVGLFTSPLFTRMLDPPAFAGEELVVMPSPFFPHKLVKGYSSPAGGVIKAVNGIPIKNLHQLVEVLRDAKGEFMTVSFAQEGYETVVFSRKELEASMEEILNDNGIRAQGSADLMAVWHAKPRK
jgi:S1-C subfamily serine protease